MATDTLTQRDNVDRMHAAEALLGVSPSVEQAKKGAMTHDDSVEAGYAIPKRLPTIKDDDSSGLDALAALASRMTPGTIIPVCGSASSSSDDDSEAMPPPPPRRRLRSCSNPEGMEKWDSLDRRQERIHFVLPSSIIEEELAEAKAAADRKEEEEQQQQRRSATILHQKRKRSPASVMSPVERAHRGEPEMGPEELLRRARSRLLEDLSEGSINGEKGVLTLPHSLSKYKDVYNRNGRIGIYTPAERAAIIARFNNKRSRRIWNKKIRYNCRKNLADRRMRVKGRFVKRSTEVMAKAPTPQINLTVPDSDMPDVNDPEAGFAPTPDQPYRRLRRHTIT